MPADGYYSFEQLDGSYGGLVRVSRDGTRFDYLAANGSWENDQDIYRHFIDPGSTFLEPIDEATVRQLADRYGACVDKPLSRKLPPQDPVDPDPWFVSPKRSVDKFLWRNLPPPEDPEDDPDPSFASPRRPTPGE